MAGEITVTILIDNDESIHALVRAAEIIAEASEDLSWREDLKEAIELLEMAASGLIAVEGHHGG